MHERANKSTNQWEFLLETHRTVVREWFHNLSLIERSMVIFIFDRTVGWNKEFERITLDQLTNGVWSADGKSYAAPVTKSRERASRVLKDLTKRGVILKVDVNKQVKLYGLNLNWKPEMKIPKKLKQKKEETELVEGARKPRQTGTASGTLGGTASGTSTGTASGTQRYNKNKNKKIREVDSDESTTHVEEVLKKTKARNRNALGKKAKRGSFLREDGTGHLPTQSGVKSAWTLLATEHFHGEFTDLGATSTQILWQYWKSWTKSKPTGEFANYLEWLFQNWLVLRVMVFGWMEDAPMAPEINVVTSLKLRGLLEEAYNRRKAVDAFAKLTPHERKMERLVKEQGVDIDTARDIVARQHLEAAEFDKLRKAKEALKKERQMFEDSKADFSARIRNKKPSKKKKPMKNTHGWKDE